MNKHSLVKPCVSFPIKADESAFGYIKRLSLHNGNLATVLFTGMTAFSSQFSRTLVPMLKQAAWTGFSQSVHSDTDSMQHFQFKHFSRTLRYCPACLSEHEYWRNSWHLRSSSACVKHGCWLIDRCGGCSALLEIVKRRCITLKQCTCGFDMTHAQQGNKCPDRVIQMQRFLEGLPPVNIGTASLISSDYQAVNFEQRSEALLMFTRFLPLEEGKRRQVYKHLSNMDEAKARFNDIAEAMFGGYIGFWQYLQVLEEFCRTGKVDRLSGFYRAFYRQFNEAFFSPYKLVLEDFINQTSSRVLSRRNSLFSDKTIQSHPWIPLQRASREYGVSKRALRRAVSADQVVAKVEAKSHNTSVLINKHDLESKLFRLTDVVNATQAASILGVTKAQFSQLRDSGAFNCLASPEDELHSTWQFSRAEIEKYANRMLGGIPLIRADYMCIPEIMRTYGSKKEGLFVDVINAIESGALTAIKFNNKPGMRSLAIRKPEVVEWIDSILPNPEYYSVPRVAKLLGLNQQFTYDLVHYGILESTQAKHYYEISDEHLTAFHLTYVLLSKLSKSAGVSSRTLI